MKYNSRDGNMYDTAGEALAADRRYEQQEKQNKFLEEQREEQEKQNQLLEKQINIQINQFEKQLSLEHDKQAFEKEQRYLKLFDDLGIIRKEYNSFVFKYFYCPSTSKIEKIEKEIEKLFEDKSRLLDELEVQSTETKLKSLKEEQKNNEAAVIISGIILTLFVLYLIFSFLVLTSVSILSVVLTFISAVIFSSCRDKQKDTKNIIIPVGIEKDINDKLITREDVERIDSQIESKSEKIGKIKSIEIKKNWDNFLDFRINHFNQKIENLFLNVELDDHIREYGIRYIKVTEEISKGKGTIDDYIEIFQDSDVFENLYKNKN